MSWVFNYFFRLSYTVGEDQGIAFSDVASIRSYILQAQSDYFLYPLLAFESPNGINDNLYAWKDPKNPYSYYDLTKDITEVFMETLLSPEMNASKSLFSTVKYWLPEKTVPQNEKNQKQSNEENVHVIVSPDGQ